MVYAPLLKSEMLVAAGPSAANSNSWFLNAFDQAAGTGFMTFVCIFLMIVALATVSRTLAERRRVRSVARDARGHSDSMREFLKIARAAEVIAGIGVWQYDCVTEKQEWSDGLKRLFGLEPDEPLVDGDAETLLHANEIDIVGWIKEHADENELFAMQFNVLCFDGTPRTISIQACNLRQADGAVQRVVAVLREVEEGAASDHKPMRAWKFAGNRGNAPASNGALPAAPRTLPETDALTGLSSRRAVMSALDGLVMNARSGKQALVLVMFDIDHFEKLIKTQGDEVAEKALKKVARLAEGHARSMDMIGRVGNEEFVWILPGTSESNARIQTERMRQAIANGSASEETPGVTISLGCAGLRPGDSALSLFARADNALFDAKQAGANRVRVAA